MSEFIEEFSKIPGINVDSALQLCGGEENLIDIAATFAGTGDKKLAELSEALSDSDLKRITIISHALKSAAALLGADELSAQAKAIEVIARAGNLEMVRNKVPAFLDEYEAYVYAVMDVVARCSNIDPEALKAKQDAVIAMNSLEK
ncbi:MAG: Hpt domain-containing protein, partial [Lachnospiraceae bacterium]|nr:Hpt domain-containing protein [Lachnospiraceae bacterium]